MPGIYCVKITDSKLEGEIQINVELLVFLITQFHALLVHIIVITLTDYYDAHKANVSTEQFSVSFVTITYIHNWPLQPFSQDY